MPLISGDHKILTGVLQQACWTGPQSLNTTTPPGVKILEECGATGCERVCQLGFEASRKVEENAIKISCIPSDIFQPRSRPILSSCL